VLADKLRGRVVECRPKDKKDRYGRPVAVCFVAGEDINGWMVAQGWALAYRNTQWITLDKNATPQVQKLGIWKYEFENPWDWRREQAEGKTVPRAESNLSKSQRPTGQRGVVYYPPGNLSGQRYQTMAECDQARQRAGNVGICVMK
jgi:Staphylococcal nuclease homologue